MDVVLCLLQWIVQWEHGIYLLAGVFIYQFDYTRIYWVIIVNRELPCFFINYVNPLPTKLYYLNFLSRYHEPQLHLGDNYSYLVTLWQHIFKSWCLASHFVPSNSDLIYKLIKQIKNDNSLFDFWFNLFMWLINISWQCGQIWSQCFLIVIENLTSVRELHM